MIYCCHLYGGPADQQSVDRTADVTESQLEISPDFVYFAEKDQVHTYIFHKMSPESHYIRPAHGLPWKVQVPCVEYVYLNSPVRLDRNAVSFPFMEL